MTIVLPWPGASGKQDRERCEEANSDVARISQDDASMTAPGPFFLYQELRRRRRLGWIYSLMCLLVAAGIGMVLSSFLTPFLLLVTGLALRFTARLGIFTKHAIAGTTAIEEWAHYQLNNFSQFVDSLQYIHSLAGLALTFGPLGRLSTVMVPALLVCALIWMRLRFLNQQAGGGDVIELLSARPPHTDNQNERRLARILETAAIAAGIPAPRLFLVDQPVINAAALGSSAKNASVLVTHGLIEAFPQAEIEAVMGRLVAAICAGDLAVAQSVDAVFQTFGLALTVIDLPVRLSAWRTLASVALVNLAPVASPKAVAGMATRLDDSLHANTIVDVDKLIEKFPSRWLGQIIIAPLLPFIIISALFKVVLFLWTSLFMGPPLWLMWRSRCLWTDATAARRNLDPKELASALGKLTGVPEGAQSRPYLFLGHPRSQQGADDQRTTSMNMALVPPSGTRTKQLLAMAGTPGAGDIGGLAHYGNTRGRLVLTILVAALLMILLPLVVALIGLVGYLTLIVMTLALAAGLTLVVGLV
jgi:Zn-dependent protease with chaperone function